jgi:hypothetical protein
MLWAVLKIIFVFVFNITAIFVSGEAVSGFVGHGPGHELSEILSPTAGNIFSG